MALLSSEAAKELSSTIEDMTGKAIDKALADYRKVYRTKDYMSAREACEYLGVSFSTLQKMREQGLKILIVGGRTIYSKKEIEEFYKEKSE